MSTKVKGRSKPKSDLVLDLCLEQTLEENGISVKTNISRKFSRKHTYIISLSSVDISAVWRPPYFRQCRTGLAGSVPVHDVDGFVFLTKFSLSDCTSPRGVGSEPPSYLVSLLAIRNFVGRVETCRSRPAPI
ncbi:hypothetical protein EVAR_41753_1 [Eumeta japonica]|uniref:Uncharacterized protein n=1 Tax=Eumeta variegata TaxID=151549 RepID=A0A4C1W1B7_EUMVA|nr:hypothetical protein EVAR_41753_1 [Eumeta japonica]